MRKNKLVTKRSTKCTLLQCMRSHSNTVPQFPLGVTWSVLCYLLQADAMLVKNAQNLMQAVVKTLKAAEAACVKVTSHFD